MAGGGMPAEGKGHGKKALDAVINVVPAIDLLSCCISFLLYTAVWTQISRLQKDIGELNIKIQEAEASFKRQIASELRDVRDRLNELDITLPAAREVRDVKLQHAGGVIKIGVKRSISVTRVRNGEGVVFDASETTPLEPGDVVDIRKLLPHEAPHQSASVGQPGLPTHQMEAGPSLRSLRFPDSWMPHD